MTERKTTDRRVLRTKQALREALDELVAEKGFESVTVEDIAARANVGRTNFYLHYQDKEDLLLDGLEEHMLTIVDEFNKHPLIFWFRSQKENLIHTMFASIQENSDKFRILTKDQSNKTFERFKKTITDTSWKLINENPWAQRKAKETSVPIELIIEYFSGAMWSSIVWWSGRNFEPSVDEMTTSFRKLFFPGLLRALNVRRIHDLIDEI